MKTKEKLLQNVPLEHYLFNITTIPLSLSNVTAIWPLWTLIWSRTKHWECWNHWLVKVSKIFNSLRSTSTRRSDETKPSESFTTSFRAFSDQRGEFSTLNRHLWWNLGAESKQTNMKQKMKAEPLKTKTRLSPDRVIATIFRDYKDI